MDEKGRGLCCQHYGIIIIEKLFYRHNLYIDRVSKYVEYKDYVQIVKNSSISKFNVRG